LDLTLLLKAAVMGVVEGLTEFLPISSTGHLILVGALMHFDDEKAKLFEVVIQTGAILAIVTLYAERLRATVAGLGHDPAARRFVANVLLGFLPAAVMGVLFAGFIKSVLFNPLVVATGFIVGGLVILWAERWQRDGRHVRIHDVDQVRWSDALKVGLVQCLALIPGTSRSGATIIGGMLLGLSRKASTEFSFFLAIPMIFGAAAYDTWKNRSLLDSADVPMFAVGLVVSWLAAWVCVRWLLRWVSTHTYTPFGWYRIVFGLVVLLTAAMGWVDWRA
jgi:undecaprenyl-diphosphatase